MRTGEERKKPEGIEAWLKRRGRWDYVENKMMGGAGREWKDIKKLAATHEKNPQELQAEIQKKEATDVQKGKKQKKKRRYLFWPISGKPSEATVSA